MLQAVLKDYNLDKNKQRRIKMKLARKWMNKSIMRCAIELLRGLKRTKINKNNNKMLIKPLKNKRKLIFNHQAQLHLKHKEQKQQ